MAKQEYELKTIESLDEVLVDGDIQTLDLTEDAWEFAAPPPAGIYDLKLFLAREGIKAGTENAKNPNSVWFQVGIECRIVNSPDGEFDDIPVFARVDTRIFRGKGISKMAGLMVELGYKIPNQIAPKKLASFMLKVLAKEPIIKGELDWRGAYSYKDKDGNDVWENVYNKYSQFPNDPENKGQKLYVVEVTSKNGGKAEVRAQTQINRFFGKVHGVPNPKGKGLVSAPRLVPKAGEPELEIAGSGVKIATNANPAIPVGAVGGSEDDDLKLLLAE